MTLDPIKLPSDDTFPHFVSQIDSQWRDKFFFPIFAPTLEGISVILVI
jgi:hypothetical protein